MNKGKADSSRYWLANWKREIEGAYLYRRLAELAADSKLRQTLARMAEQEEQHSSLWRERLKQAGVQAPQPRPDLRIHMIAWVAKWLGPRAVLGFLINDEVSDIATYAGQFKRLGDPGTYHRVLGDETEHARTLAGLREAGRQAEEPWHRTASAGGWLRNVVYGFNDGLTANFGLVMGVVGAAVNDKVILLAGFAGLLADALSMAASGFLAARSEQEVKQYHLALEEAEVQLMPEEERQELAQYFEQKGLTPDEASKVAGRLMEQPRTALTQLAREELGIDPEAKESPLGEGVVTGIATGLGAVIPIVPFLFLAGPAAIWTGVGISMAAHFVVGGSRAIFTGRPAIRSGFEMFVVGMGVALVTFFLGQIFGVKL